VLPEEEEYEAASGGDGTPPALSFEDEMRTLVTLSFGVVIIVAIAMAVLVVAYALTGWTALLVMNLVIAVLAIIAFIYLMYRRSRLTMGY
jgi:cyanate permease